jgi:hypothetical protein
MNNLYNEDKMSFKDFAIAFSFILICMATLYGSFLLLTFLKESNYEFMFYAVSFIALTATYYIASLLLTIRPLSYIIMALSSLFFAKACGLDLFMPIYNNISIAGIIATIAIVLGLFELYSTKDKENKANINAEDQNEELYQNSSELFHQYAERINNIKPRERAINSFYECPCCDAPVIGEIGGYEICTICKWEDDGQSKENENECWPGPNGGCSLAEYRNIYVKERQTKEEKEILDKYKNKSLSKEERLKASFDILNFNNGKEQTLESYEKYKANVDLCLLLEEINDNFNKEFKSNEDEFSKIIPNGLLSLIDSNITYVKNEFSENIKLLNDKDKYIQQLFVMYVIINLYNFKESETKEYIYDITMQNYGDVLTEPMKIQAQVISIFENDYNLDKIIKLLKELHNISKDNRLDRIISNIEKFL